MRVLFFGTPEFALPSLGALMESAHEVKGIVCRPDSPAGRGLKLEPPPVGKACMEFGLPIHQPERLKRGEMETLFRETKADVGVVVAYGKILRRWLLEAPRFGFVNVHASILPKYRGAAPIARAIIAGERETGVTIMRLDEGVDTGPVYFDRKTRIDPEETAGELSSRLAGIGAAALVEALEGIEAGTLATRPQEGEATVAPPLAREDGRISWSGPAETIHNLVRGVNPWPGATAGFRDGDVRIWRTTLHEVEVTGVPGEVVTARKTVLRVATGKGVVDLLELQLPGKKRVSALDFINGTRVKPGEKFE